MQGPPPEIWQVKARFILALTFHTAGAQAIWRSGADSFIIPLPFTRLGLYPWNKAWIYNAVATALTFPAEGKLGAHPRHQRVYLTKIIFFILTRQQ